VMDGLAIRAVAQKIDREKLANEIAIQVLNQWETDRKFDQTRS